MPSASTRHVTTGQDNWRYRTGYQRTSRVPGPIVSDAKPPLLARLFGVRTR